jgi:hypothetical protein
MVSHGAAWRLVFTSWESQPGEQVCKVLWNFTPRRLLAWLAPISWLCSGERRDQVKGAGWNSELLPTFERAEWTLQVWRRLFFEVGLQRCLAFTQWGRGRISGRCGAVSEFFSPSGFAVTNQVNYLHYSTSAEPTWSISALWRWNFLALSFVCFLLFR